MPIARARCVTDHFHVYGNLRGNVLAKDQGYVELFSADRSFRWLNQFDLATNATGGGYSYLRAAPVAASAQGSNAGGATASRGTEPAAVAASTAYIFAPNASGVSAFNRTWGVGYAAYTTDLASSGVPVAVTHVLTAPAGNHSFVVDEVTIAWSGSPSGGAWRVSHFEHWDVNVQQLETELLRSGLAAPVGNELRALINEVRASVGAAALPCVPPAHSRAGARKRGQRVHRHALA